MNERIKQLQSQCWEERPYGPLWFNSTKFAELFLRELIDKISQEQDIAEQNWQCKNGVHICQKLTDHFGVTE